MTLVFGGAVNVKTDAGGLLKVTDVNAVSNAGAVAPLAKTWTRSGT